jgi:hypothetical protein
VEGRYFVRTNEGVRFLDLLSGEPIEPGRPQHFYDVVAQHGAVLALAEIVAIEAQWERSADRPSVPAYEQARVKLCADVGRRAKFQQAQVSWLSKRGKTTLPCDYYNESDPLCEASDELWRISRSADDNDGDEHRLLPGAAKLSYMVSDWHEPMARWLGSCNVATEVYRTSHLGLNIDLQNYGPVFSYARAFYVCCQTNSC